MSNAIMESIGKYLGLIGGDSIDTNKSFQIGSYINLNTNDVKESLENKGLDVIVLGNGDRIINQYPINTTLLQGDKIFLLTNDSNVKMPSLIGYTKIECISLLNLLNVDYEFEGYGYVTEQSIKVGESINDKIKIILKERQ